MTACREFARFFIDINLIGLQDESIRFDDHVTRKVRHDAVGILAIRSRVVIVSFRR